MNYILIAKLLIISWMLTGIFASFGLLFSMIKFYSSEFFCFLTTIIFLAADIFLFILFMSCY
jgi:hypothetical protein